MDVAARLAAAGLELPPAPEALGDYLPAVVAGSLVFTAGQLPSVAGRLMTTGRVGAEVDPSTAAACAERCALNALAAASTACDLDRVRRVVKLTVYVASADGFRGQPQVADGASRILVAAFGESGRHAREAVGVADLPLGAPVELSLVLDAQPAGEPGRNPERSAE